jgi:hypothetical protein
MRKSIISFLVYFGLSMPLISCSEQIIEPPKKIETPSKIIDMKNCVCVQLWMPVCGENGKTYSNSCFADCAGVKFTQGSCTKVIKD